MNQPTLRRLGASLPLLSLFAGTAGTAAAADQCGAVLESLTPRQVAAGFQYVEGPAWDARAASFVFSDIAGNTVYQIGADGKPGVRRAQSGYANGNAFDRDGNLWSAQHNRTLTRTTREGVSSVVLDQFEGKPLNSPNDLAIAADGAVWFTDPPFGIQGYGPVKAEEQQAVRGVYRYRNGVTQLMSGALTLPNGIAFSPEQTHLYVADTADGTVYRFAVAADGALSGKTAFATLAPAAGQTPMVDGIRTDSQGNLWMTGPASIGVFSAKGEQLCRLPIAGGHVSNLAFGGADGRDVLITVTDHLVSLRSKIKGW